MEKGVTFSWLVVDSVVEYRLSEVGMYKYFYHALRFTDPITAMGSKLVSPMRRRSKHYIALHLR